MRIFVLSACLLASAGYLQYATKSEPIPLRSSFAEFPMRIGQWQGSLAPDFEPEILAVLGVSDYMNRVYTSSGGSVGVYVGFYESQRQGDSIHSPMNCLPGAGWQPVKSGRQLLPVQASLPVNGVAGPSSTIEINRYLLEKGSERLLVYYWYQSHGRVVASEYWGKFYMVWDALRMNRTDAALVRVIAPVSTSGSSPEEHAETLGADFVRNIFPLLGRHLPA